MKRKTALLLAAVLTISAGAYAVSAPEQAAVPATTVEVEAPSRTPFRTAPAAAVPRWTPPPIVITPEPVVSTPEPVVSTPEPVEDTETIIVYVTETGSKYHDDGCQYLRKSKIPMELEDAQASYGPCSRCHPPE